MEQGDTLGFERGSSTLDLLHRGIEPQQLVRQNACATQAALWSTANPARNAGRRYARDYLSVTPYRGQADLLCRRIEDQTQSYMSLYTPLPGFSTTCSDRASTNIEPSGTGHGKNGWQPDPRRWLGALATELRLLKEILQRLCEQ